MEKEKLMKYSRILLILFVLFWMYIIFQFSADNATDSAALSNQVLEYFYRIVYHFTGKRLDLAIGLESQMLLGYFFRKLAHMFIYFILSIFVMLFLFTFKVNMWLRIFTALAFCGVYAVSDEYHQLFSEGRGARLKDVLIDCSGAFVGIFVALILFCIIYTIYHIHEEKNKKLSINEIKR